MQSNEKHPQLLYIVFGDVTGYGSMMESDVWNFSKTVVPDLARLASVHRCKTNEIIGDAILAVFDHFESAANFALAVRDYFKQERWRARAQIPLSAQPKMRIALHQGKVFCESISTTSGHDSVRLFGSEISHTARIQSIVAPNQVFATKLALPLDRWDHATDFSRYFPSPGVPDSFVARSVGTCRLPKEHRQEELFWLGRRDNEWDDTIKPNISHLRYFNRRKDADEFIAHDIKTRNRPISKACWLGFNGGSSFKQFWESIEDGLAAGAELEICLWDSRCSGIPVDLLEKRLPGFEPNDSSEIINRRALQAEIERIHNMIKKDYDTNIRYDHISELCCEYLINSSGILASANRHQDDARETEKLVKKTIVPALKRIGGRVCIKECPLYVPARIALIGDLAFFALYLFGTNVGPILMATKHSSLYEQLEQHFSVAWEHGAVLYEMSFCSKSNADSSK